MGRWCEAKRFHMKAKEAELAGLTRLCESLGLNGEEWRRDSLGRESHQCVSQSRGSSVKCKGRRFIPGRTLCAVKLQCRSMFPAGTPDTLGSSRVFF